MAFLSEEELGEVIEVHFCEPGDRMFRKEGLAWYDVPSQNSDRDAWLAGAFDPTQIEEWATILAADKERGLVSQRLRIVSAHVTDDEAMSLHAALPIISRHVDVRVLHRGEHPVPDLVDHDYWVIRPAAGRLHVVAMHYTVGGAFEGAEIVPADRHGPYLQEQELGWALAVPYGQWWAAHPELHRTPIP